jgi:hypothetical protein
MPRIAVSQFGTHNATWHRAARKNVGILPFRLGTKLDH